MPHTLDLEGKNVTVLLVDAVHLHRVGDAALSSHESHSELRPGMAPERRRIFTSTASHSHEEESSESRRRILSDDHGKKGGGGGGAASDFMMNLLIGLLAVILFIFILNVARDWFFGTRTVYETRTTTTTTAVTRPSTTKDCAIEYSGSRSGISTFLVPTDC